MPAEETSNSDGGETIPPNKSRQLSRAKLRRADLNTALVLVMVATFDWFSFANGSDGLSSDQPIPVIAELLLAASWVFTIGVFAFGGNRNRLAMTIRTLAAIGLLLWTYASLYYSYGTAANFGHVVSRADAAYIALGVFSTAGTSPFTPSSEISRLIVLSQYAIDVVFVLILLSMIVARLIQSDAEEESKRLILEIQVKSLELTHELYSDLNKTIKAINCLLRAESADRSNPSGQESVTPPART